MADNDNGSDQASELIDTILNSITADAKAFERNEDNLDAFDAVVISLEENSEEIDLSHKWELRRDLGSAEFAVYRRENGDVFWHVVIDTGEQSFEVLIPNTDVSSLGMFVKKEAWLPKPAPAPQPKKQSLWGRLFNGAGYEPEPSRSGSVLGTLGNLAIAGATAYAASRAVSRDKQIIGVQSLGQNGSKIMFSDGSWRQVQGQVTGYTSDNYTTSHFGSTFINSADGRSRRQIF
jgi:hypothetical protein